MNTSRLVWWVFWRGLLLGAIQGALFGTIIALGYGSGFGFIVGGLLGAVLGLINGISLAFITRSHFDAYHNSARYLKSIRQAALPLDMLVVFVCSLPFTAFLAIIPALIAAADVYYLSPAFAAYAESLMSPTHYYPPTPPSTPTNPHKRFAWLSKNRIVLLNLILVIALAARIVGAPQEKPRVPYRYLIPVGYTGWVNIYFHVVSTPPLPIEDGHYLLVIPSDGVLKTSSDAEYGLASDDDYYSYQADGTRKPLLETGPGGGGKIWGNGYDSDGLGNIFSIFYVGTEAQYNQRFLSTPTHQPTANTLSPK